jgi:hypothetical protein
MQSAKSLAKVMSKEIPPPSSFHHFFACKVYSIYLTRTLPPPPHTLSTCRRRSRACRVSSL